MSEDFFYFDQSFYFDQNFYFDRNFDFCDEKPVSFPWRIILDSVWNIFHKTFNKYETISNICIG